MRQQMMMWHVMWHPSKTKINKTSPGNMPTLPKMFLVLQTQNTLAWYSAFPKYHLPVYIAVRAW